MITTIAIGALGAAAIKIITEILAIAFFGFAGWLIQGFMNASADIASSLMTSVYDLFFNDKETVYNAGLEILFPNSFFGVNFNLANFIVKVATALMCLCIIIGVIKSMMAPATGEESESPTSIMWHAVIGGLLMWLFFGNPRLFFSRIKVAPDGTFNILQIGLNALKSAFDGMGIRNMLTAGDASTALSKYYGGFSNFENIVTNGIANSAGQYVLGLIMSGTLIIMVIRASISFLERILSFCLYLVLGPLCFALYPLKETRGLAKEWILSAFAQILAIFFSTLMWATFINRFNNLSVDNGVQGAILDLAMCVVILTLCEKVEQLLNAIGLRTLPNSDAAHNALLGSGIMSMAWGLSKGIANGFVDSIHTGVKGAKAKQSAQAATEQYNKLLSAAKGANGGVPLNGSGKGVNGNMISDAVNGKGATAGLNNADMLNPDSLNNAGALSPKQLEHNADMAGGLMQNGNGVAGTYSKLTAKGKGGGGLSSHDAATAIGNAESSRIDNFAKMNDADAMRAAGASNFEAMAATNMKAHAASGDDMAVYNAKAKPEFEALQSSRIDKFANADPSKGDVYANADAMKAAGASDIEAAAAMNIKNYSGSEPEIYADSVKAAAATAGYSRIEAFANTDPSTGTVYSSASAMKAAGASDGEIAAATKIQNYAGSSEMQQLQKSDPDAYNAKLSAYSDSVKSAYVTSELVGAGLGVSSLKYDSGSASVMDSISFKSEALSNGFGADLVQDTARNYGITTDNDGNAVLRKIDVSSMGAVDEDSFAMAERWNKLADYSTNGDRSMDGSTAAHLMGLSNADTVSGTAYLCQTEDGKGAAIVMHDDNLGNFAITNGEVSEGERLYTSAGIDTGYTVQFGGDNRTGACKVASSSSGDSFDEPDNAVKKSESFNELLNANSAAAVALNEEDSEEEKTTMKSLYNRAKVARAKRRLAALSEEDQG